MGPSLPESRSVVNGLFQSRKFPVEYNTGSLKESVNTIVHPVAVAGIGGEPNQNCSKKVQSRTSTEKEGAYTRQRRQECGALNVTRVELSEK
jgi:hypothetical protein